MVTQIVMHIHQGEMLNKAKRSLKAKCPLKAKVPT